MRGAIGLVGRARARAESLMVDACTVKSPTPTLVTNSTTGKVTPTHTTLYTGKCRLQSQAQMFPTMPEAAEHQHTVAPLFLHLPVSAAALPSGALVEVTASHDPLNVGRKLRVRMSDRKTLQSAVRYLVEELVA